MVYRIPAVFAEARWSTQLSFYKRPDRNVSTFSTLGIFESLELAILDVCRVQALNSNSELISFPWFGHQNYLKNSDCHTANMLHFRDPSVSWVCLAIWKTVGRSFFSSLIWIAQAPMLSASLAKYTCTYVIHVFCSQLCLALWAPCYIFSEPAFLQPWNYQAFRKQKWHMFMCVI